jgi:hypothetical protein
MKVFTKLLMREIVYIEHPSAYQYIIKLLFSSISKPLNLNKIKNLIEDLDLKNKVEFGNYTQQSPLSPTPAKEPPARTLQLNPPSYPKFDPKALSSPKFDPNYPFTGKMDGFSQNSLLFLQNRNLSNERDHFGSFPWVPPHLAHRTPYQQQNFGNLPDKNQYLQQVRMNQMSCLHPVNAELYFDQIKFYKQKMNHLESHLQVKQLEQRPDNFRQNCLLPPNRSNSNWNNLSRNSQPSSANSQRSYKTSSMMQATHSMSGFAPF